MSLKHSYELFSLNNDAMQWKVLLYYNPSLQTIVWLKPTAAGCTDDRHVMFVSMEGKLLILKIVN